MKTVCILCEHLGGDNDVVYEICRLHELESLESHKLILSHEKRELNTLRFQKMKSEVI